MNIPVFILAGGKGTRLSEETQFKPKPMVEIKGEPILIHIMRHYYKYGFNDFVICAGYRSWDIKQYFLTYQDRTNIVDIDCRNNFAVYNRFHAVREKWRVRVLDTGEDTMTGGRLARAFDEVCDAEHFLDFAVTYGDGLCDVNLSNQYAFHSKHGSIGTVLGVSQPSRFGELEISQNGLVSGFQEKPTGGSINGGFFFFKRSFRDFLSRDSACVLEKEPLTRLAMNHGLRAYHHDGFWHCMDTLRDKEHLESVLT